MKTIYKYQFEISSVIEILMPEKSQVVHVGLQNSIPCIWAEVPKSNINIVRRFGIFGTGHDIPDSCEHIATFIDGNFVWHLYEWDKS
jgi:hypothetical protein